MFFHKYIFNFISMKKLNKIKDLLPVPSFSVIIVCFFFPFIVVKCGGKSLVSLSGTQLAIGTNIDESKFKKDDLMNSLLGGDKGLLGDEKENSLSDEKDSDAEEVTKNAEEAVDNAAGESYKDDNSTDKKEAEEAVAEDVSAKEKSKKIDPNPLIITPLILAIIGFILGFIRFRRKPITLIILSSVGFLSLFLFRLAWMAKVNEQLTGSGDDFGMGAMLGIEFGNAFYLAMILFVIVAFFFMYYLYEEKNFQREQIAVANSNDVIDIDDDDDDDD